MIYGTTTLTVLAGTLQVKKRLMQKVRHYPGTDISDKSDLGRPPTIIKCTLVVKTDAARLAVEQLMNGDTEESLIFTTRYYKDVIPGAANNARLKTTDELAWYIDVEFIALDPIPYSVSTDVRLY